mgnify:CR=1 FL=1
MAKVYDKLQIETCPICLEDININEKIIKSYIILDLLNLMKQVGLSPISPSLGTDLFWPGPATTDGVRIDDKGYTNSRDSFEVVMKMHKALGEYDGKNIESMKHSQYLSLIHI